MRRLRDLPANHTPAPRFFDRGGKDVLAELIEEMFDEVDAMQRAQEAAEVATALSAPALSGGMRASRRRLIPHVPSVVSRAPKGLRASVQPVSSETGETTIADRAIVVAAGSLAIEKAPSGEYVELPPDHFKGDLAAFIAESPETETVAYVPGTPVVDQPRLQQVQ